ncbi:UPF0280 family protein [bacterium]|nr:UPF0280 family protein [bacterium]
MRWQRHHFELKETIVTLLCKAQYLSAGEQALHAARTLLEQYIDKYPLFATTHAPYHPQKDAPEIVQRMCRESEKVGVGPMAAVAGALALESLTAILRAGADEAIVDNGGDIALFIREPVKMGIFAGNASLKELAFEVEPRKTVFGICTSSGTVGPSHSYGKSDAAVIISPNILLADAAATALGNRIKEEKDLKAAFDFLKKEEEIEGALAIIHDRIGMFGTLPKLIRSHIDTDLITKGRQG